MQILDADFAMVPRQKKKRKMENTKSISVHKLSTGKKQGQMSIRLEGNTVHSDSLMCIEHYNQMIN